MIKLAALAFLPVLAATFYVQPGMPPATAVDNGRETQDRTFLTQLTADERSAGKVERADREFLERLQAQEIPVRKALPIERPQPVAPAAPPAAPAALAREMPEIRRAIPVVAPRTDLRANLHQSYTTMAEPEVRRAAAVHRERASITILGDRVIITPGSAPANGVSPGLSEL